MKPKIVRTICLIVIGIVILSAISAITGHCWEKKSDIPELTEVEQLQLQSITKDMLIYQQQQEIIRYQFITAQTRFVTAQTLLANKIAEYRVAHKLDKSFDIINDNGVFKIQKIEKSDE